jgi:hypothetical protein
MSVADKVVTWLTGKTAQEREAERAARDAAWAAKRAARELHEQRLTKAAGISTVKLHCHGDTWTELYRLAWPLMGWKTVSPFQGPVVQGPSYKDDGIVVVTLSGPNLVKILTETRPWHLQPSHWSPGPVARAPAKSGQQLMRVLKGRSGRRAWCRRAAAMLVAPVRRRMLMARLRRVAMTRGPLWVRTWERSSS